MKVCRKCKEEFSDKVTKCLYCGGPVERILIVDGKIVEAPDIKEDKPKGKDYRMVVVMTVLAMAGIFFLMSEMSGINIRQNQRTEKAPLRMNAPFVERSDNPLISEPTNVSANDATGRAVSEEAIRLMRNAFALCNSGKCTDAEKAILYLSEAIKLQPNIAEAYNNRGNAYADLQQYELAIEDYNEAIRLKPDYAHAYYNRGLAYHDLDQHQRAIDDFSEVIRLKPDETNAYYNRGNEYFILGNKELGCNDALKACELGNCKLIEFARKKKYCPEQ